MKHFLPLIVIFLLLATPIFAEKSKGLFSGEILQADLDSFTSNVSETPDYLPDNQSAVQSNSQDISDWMDIGKTQLKSNNWKPAEETFLKVIDKDPKNTDGWEGYLLAIRGGGNFEELLDASEHATKENPGFASAWKYDGIALSCLDRSEEALSAFDKALQVDPKYYTAWYYKGIALDSLRRFNESVKAYESVLIQNPKYAKAWNNKGVALSQIGRYDDAIAAYDKALEIEPAYQKALKNKEKVLTVKGSKSLTNTDVIDDSAEFNSSDTVVGTSGDSVSLVITVTPTPTVSSDIPEVLSQIQTLVPTIREVNNEGLLVENKVELTPTPETWSPQKFYGKAEFNGYPLRVGDRVMATTEGVDLSSPTNPFSVAKFGEFGDIEGNEMLTVEVPNAAFNQSDPITFWINPQGFEYWYKARIENPLSTDSWNKSNLFTPGSITNLQLTSTDRDEFRHFYYIATNVKNVIMPDDYTGW